MSLINQMLQDLENRGALTEPSTLPSYVRPVQESKHFQNTKALGIGVATVAVAIALYGLYLEKNKFDDGPVTSITPTKEPTSTTTASGVILESQISKQQGIVQKIQSKHRPIETSDYSLRFDSVLGNKNVSQSDLDETQPIKENVTKPAPTFNSPLVQAAPLLNTSDNTVIDKKPRYTSPTEKAEAEYRKAMLLLNQAKTEEAIYKLRSALKEDANYAIARQTLVSLFIEQKRFDEAEELLQETLRTNPAQPISAIKLARIQVEKGNNKAAHETLQRSATFGINDPNYRAFHAGILQRIGDHTSAINEYQAALKLAPEANVWWMGLGISLEAQGKTAEARDAFTHARAGGTLSPELDQFVQQKLSQLK